MYLVIRQLATSIGLYDVPFNTNLGHGIMNNDSVEDDREGVQCGHERVSSGYERLSHLPSELSSKHGGSHPEYFCSRACLSPMSSPTILTMMIGYTAGPMTMCHQRARWCLTCSWPPGICAAPRSSSPSSEPSWTLHWWDDVMTSDTIYWSAVQSGVSCPLSLSSLGGWQPWLPSVLHHLCLEKCRLTIFTSQQLHSLHTNSWLLL